MGKALRFLIPDGYPPESRDEFDRVGMRQAWKLYADLLLKHLPGATYDVWLSSDPGSPTAPALDVVAGYDGILWPGCNLTVFEDDPRVHRHLTLAERAFEAGTPQFGSCWAIQIASHVAGGAVARSPKGREMGFAAKIQLTEAGLRHPMYSGKPPVFCHLVSHDDEVVRLPEGALHLAGNAWSAVQAAEIRHKRGLFWGVQYHPEYDLHEMARLIEARAGKLIKLGYFRGEEDLRAYVARLDALVAEPDRKDLRWQLRIDGDVLDDAVRECEFANWLRHVALPRAGLTEAAAAP